MVTKNDILWFKQEFAAKINSAVIGTPFTVDMLAAIACQETGYIWVVLSRNGLSTDKILALCVGDTLDAPNRSAFPKTKTELLLKPNGDKMFTIARQALVEMVTETGGLGYQAAAKNPDKFCHGFGIFQYDLQFFLTDPGYFLNQDYKDFDKCLGKCLEELKRCLKKVGLQSSLTLTNMEMAAVAIAYNTGGYIKSKKLKQGHFDGNKFYGEAFFDFLTLCQSVSGLPPVAEGERFTVQVLTELNLRSAPVIVADNVIASLPNGQVVEAVTGLVVNGFIEVDTLLSGTTFRGFASTQFLK